MAFQSMADSIFYNSVSDTDTQCLKSGVDLTDPDSQNRKPGFDFDQGKNGF